MKRLKITVDGTPYDVTVEEISDGAAAPAPAPAPAPVAAAPAAPSPAPAPAPAASAAPAAQGGGAPGEVVSPLAGTVLEVVVSAGQAVNAGDDVLKLEAMKMESMVVAPVAGTVKSVDVAGGDSVQEGQVLLTIG